MAQHYFNSGQCIVLSSGSGAGILKVASIMQQSEMTVQSPNAVSMTVQRRRLWVNIETALVECHVAQSIQQIGAGSAS